MKRLYVLAVALLAVWALLVAVLLELLARLVWVVNGAVIALAKGLARVDDALCNLAFGLMDTARDWIRWATR